MREQQRPPWSSACSRKARRPPASSPICAIPCPTGATPRSASSPTVTPGSICPHPSSPEGLHKSAGGLDIRLAAPSMLGGCTRRYHRGNPSLSRRVCDHLERRAWFGQVPAAGDLSAIHLGLQLVTLTVMASASPTDVVRLELLQYVAPVEAETADNRRRARLLPMKLRRLRPKSTVSTHSRASDGQSSAASACTGSCGRNELRLVALDRQDPW